MNKSFNLSKFMKTAFYDDGRGNLNMQTRAWNNCRKHKCDDGADPQDAWDSCLREYQSANSKSDWILSYTSAQGCVAERPDLKTPAAKEITSKK
jgi:hypothetical protein